MEARTLDPPAVAVRPATDPAPDAREARYGRLMAQGRGFANDDLFARMLASQELGSGALPPGLGLGWADFTALMARHFPGCSLPGGEGAPAQAERQAEREDLLALFTEHRAGKDDSERWMAEIVATACMGGDHLWKDLGLWSRADLSRLLTQKFPALAAKNTRDMKWKKFLYKQLCEREELFICKAPSCAVCVDRPVCFGPED